MYVLISLFIKTFHARPSWKVTKIISAENFACNQIMEKLPNCIFLCRSGWAPDCLRSRMCCASKMPRWWNQNSSENNLFPLAVGRKSGALLRSPKGNSGKDARASFFFLLGSQKTQTPSAPLSGEALFFATQFFYYSPSSVQWVNENCVVYFLKNREKLL